jgi:hypothetical protein
MSSVLIKNFLVLLAHTTFQIKLSEKLNASDWLVTSTSSTIVIGEERATCVLSCRCMTSFFCHNLHQLTSSQEVVVIHNLTATTLKFLIVSNVRGTSVRKKKDSLKCKYGTYIVLNGGTD